jgi:hypothetical protein
LNQKRIKLKQALQKNKSGCNGKIGRCHNKILQLLVLNIRNRPSLDNFIAFVETLNFFYSTRLQSAKGNKNEIIIVAAQLLKDNWKRRTKLCDVSAHNVDANKVESLRAQFRIVFINDYFSFVTKVFHILNDQYPIIDTRVKNFLKQHGFSRKVNYSNRPYSEFYKKIREVMKELNWRSVESFDLAVWELMGND